MLVLEAAVKTTKLGDEVHEGKIESDNVTMFTRFSLSLNEIAPVLGLHVKLTVWLWLPGEAKENERD